MLPECIKESGILISGRREEKKRELRKSSIKYISPITTLTTENLRQLPDPPHPTISQKQEHSRSIPLRARKPHKVSRGEFLSVRSLLNKGIRQRTSTFLGQETLISPSEHIGEHIVDYGMQGEVYSKKNLGREKQVIDIALNSRGEILKGGDTVMLTRTQPKINRGEMETETGEARSPECTAPRINCNPPSIVYNNQIFVSGVPVVINNKIYEGCPHQKHSIRKNSPAPEQKDDSNRIHHSRSLALFPLKRAVNSTRTSKLNKDKDKDKDKDQDKDIYNKEIEDKLDYNYHNNNNNNNNNKKKDCSWSSYRVTGGEDELLRKCIHGYGNYLNPLNKESSFLPNTESSREIPHMHKIKYRNIPLGYMKTTFIPIPSATLLVNKGDDTEGRSKSVNKPYKGKKWTFGGFWDSIMDSSSHRQREREWGERDPQYNEYNERYNEYNERYNEGYNEGYTGEVDRDTDSELDKWTEGEDNINNIKNINNIQNIKNIENIKNMSYNKHKKKRHYKDKRVYLPTEEKNSRNLVIKLPSQSSTSPYNLSCQSMITPTYHKLIPDSPALPTLPPLSSVSSLSSLPPALTQISSTPKLYPNSNSNISINTNITELPECILEKETQNQNACTQFPEYAPRPPRVIINRKQTKDKSKYIHTKCNEPNNKFMPANKPKQRRKINKRDRSLGQDKLKSALGNKSSKSSKSSKSFVSNRPKWDISNKTRTYEDQMTFRSKSPEIIIPEEERIQENKEEWTINKSRNSLNSCKSDPIIRRNILTKPSILDSCGERRELINISFTNLESPQEYGGRIRDLSFVESNVSNISSQNATNPQHRNNQPTSLNKGSERMHSDLIKKLQMKIKSKETAREPINRRDGFDFSEIIKSNIRNKSKLLNQMYYSGNNNHLLKGKQGKYLQIKQFLRDFNKFDILH